MSPNYQNVGFAVSTGKLNGEDTVLVVEMLGSTSIAPAIAEAKSQPTAAVGAGSPTVKLATTNANAPIVPKVQTAAKPVTQESLGINSLPIIKPLINSQNFSLTLTEIVLFAFIVVLILDMVIIERRKIVRFVGHNLDHVIFFSLILIIVLILVKGVIV